MKDIDQFRWLRQQLPDQNYFGLTPTSVPIPGIPLRKPSPSGELDPLYVIETQQWPAQLDICTAGRKSIFMNAEGDLLLVISAKLKWVIYINNGSILPPAAKQCHCFLAYQHRLDIPLLNHRMPHAVLGSDAHAISFNRF